MATAPNPKRILRHWKVLCETIGDRRAGSLGEQAAAEYLATGFTRLGLANVQMETFPCVSVVKAEADVQVRFSDRFEQVPARPLAGSPPTPDGQVVDGKLVWVEMPEQADRLFTPQLRGKIVVLVGPIPTHADLHRRLVQCEPAAVLHLDDRLPFEWVKDDGVFPVWAERYGMPPIAAVPFRVGWELRKRGATRARVRLEVERHSGLSQNVIAEIPGLDPTLPVVLLGAHHDTQDLSNQKRFPFSRGLAPEQRAESFRIGRELFDLSPSHTLKKPSL